MDADRPSKGWHPGPAGEGRWRYWDGRRWSGFAQRRATGGASHGHYRLRGWRQLWYGRIVRLPFVFYPLAWLDCSVPFTRGHLGGLLRPAEARFAPPPDDPA